MTQAGTDTDGSLDVLNSTDFGCVRAIDGLTDETTRIYRGFRRGSGMAALGGGTSPGATASRCLALRRRAVGVYDVR